MTFLFRVLLPAFLLGAITSWTGLPPREIWPVAFIGLSGIYILLTQQPNLRRSFFTIYLFSLGYFIFGLDWIATALTVEGNEAYVWAIPLSICGLPLLLSLFTATFVTLARKFFDFDTLSGFLMFAVALCFGDWLRGHAFTGFPWNSFGLIWADSLIMQQSVSLFGMWGLGLLTLLIMTAPGFAYLRVRQNQSGSAITALCILALITLGLWAYGAIRLTTAPPVPLDNTKQLVIIQPNISQDQKWTPQSAWDNHMRLVETTNDALASLPDVAATNYIIWPETAVNERIFYDPAALEFHRSFFQANNVFLTGLLRSEETPQDGRIYFNSIGMFAENAAPVYYSKSRLVPFGEFIPDFVKKIVPIAPVVEFGNFEHGNGAETFPLPGGLKIAPLICYEVIFPGVVVDRHGSRPDLIVNVTNDGWYGDSAGPYQHFAQTRLRAIEEGLPLARSANTGISALIDPYGRTLKAIPLLEKGYISYPLPYRLAPTPYARFGDVSYGVLSLILMSAAIGLKRRK